MDARAFARSLPLHAVRELHVSGPTFVAGLGHQEMAEEDYELLARVLARTGAEIVTLEYSKARTVRGTLEEQAEALERQLNRLRAMM